MHYLILDPLEGYSARMVEFLGARGFRGIAVLSDSRAGRSWSLAASRRLGQHIDASYVVEDPTGLEALAARLLDDFPAGFLGIIPWAEDNVLLGAQLGDLLSLNWNPARVIERCRDKRAMKAWLRTMGTVRLNAGRVVVSAQAALGFQARVGSWPIVVKPVGGSGAENVYFPMTGDELLRDCQRVFESGDEVLLEEFIGGDEFVVNGVADRDGNLLVTDVWRYDKRPGPGGPNLYVQTIKISTSEEIFHELGGYAAAVIRSLELRRAPVHMEVKVDGRGPCLIEVGARLGGGNQPLLASKLHGRSLFELVACHYLTELQAHVGELSYDRYDRNEARIVSGVAERELPVIHRVHGVDQVERLPSFEGFGFLRKQGQPLPLTRDLGTKSYEAYLMHPDPQQIARDTQAVWDLLRFE